MSEHIPEIDITAGPGEGSYNIFALYSKDSVTTTAQGLLEIAAYVELHRNQLRKEAGQEITRYRVALHKSRVTPLGSTTPEAPIDAIDAQEAARLAMLLYGARRMALVSVVSAGREDDFEDVEL